MPRKPIVAGMFYEGSADALNAQITDSFLLKFGPSALPCKRTDEKMIGGVVPHAGYAFSGACAAHFYKEIAESAMPDCFLMLGTDHSGSGVNATMLDDWETPLGIVKCDVEFAKSIANRRDIMIDERVHAGEHSIEVQLPFLQFISKDCASRLRIVPLLVGMCDYGKIAEMIVQRANTLKKSICVIASSDFTHYGYSYGFVPFRGNVAENLKKLDMGAIKFIEKLDCWSFLNYIKETKATICGSNPIALAIEIAKRLGAKNAEVLKYYNSGDVVEDYSNAVGYASIAFR